MEKTRTKVVIFVNDVKFEAERKELTGAEIKSLAGVPSQNRLFKEVPGPRDDVPVADGEEIELQNGDRFYDLPVGVHGAPTLKELLTPDLKKIGETLAPVEVRELPDSTLMVVVGPVSLPAPWDPALSRVVIVVPPGYPEARPGGFFAEPNLLVNGSAPKCSGQNQVGGEMLTYICWQPATWNPHSDGLWKYAKLMVERFEEAA